YSVEGLMEDPVVRSLEHLVELCPVDRLPEVEALGPLTVLSPGQRTNLGVRFGLGTGTGPVTEVTTDGFWSRPPRWGDREPDGWRLTGTFTSTRPGVLAHEESGHTVTRTRPGEPACFDVLIPELDDD